MSFLVVTNSPPQRGRPRLRPGPAPAAPGSAAFGTDGRQRWLISQSETREGPTRGRRPSFPRFPNFPACHSPPPSSASTMAKKKNKQVSRWEFLELLKLTSADYSPVVLVL